MSRVSVIALLLACTCATAFGRELQAAHGGASKVAAGDASKAAIVKATEAVDLKKLMAYKHNAGYETVTGFGCLRGSIATYGVEDVAECKALCNKDPRCGAFTYSNTKTRCYIKPSCVPKERKASTTNDSFVKKAFTALSEAEEAAYTAAVEKMEEEADKAKAERREKADELKFLDKDGKYDYTGAYDNFPKEGCLRGTIEAVFVENMMECKTKCNKDPRCGAVTFNSEIARCYLKPNCKDGERKPSDTNQSARKQMFASPDQETIDAFLAEKAEEKAEETTEETVEEETTEEVAERPAGEYTFAQGKRCVPAKGGMLSQSAVEKTVDCRTACDEDPKCTSYAFRNTNKMCRLFTACEKMVNDPAWFTATRTN